MAGNNPALRIVATGEIVTVAKYRARQLLASGAAVPAGDGGEIATAAGIGAMVREVLAKRPSLRNLAHIVSDGSIAAHELTVDVDLGAWPLADPGLASRKIAAAIESSEGANFIHGDGLGKPRGILTLPIRPDHLRADGEVGYVLSGALGDFDLSAPTDCLIDLVYGLNSLYRENACFLMNAKTVAAIGKLKDTEGRYLWGDGLASDKPPRLLGFPVLICEEMPDIDVQSHAVAFGDFRAAYTVSIGSEVQVSRGPINAQSDGLIRATWRIGGEVTNPDAFRLLRFS